MWLFEKLKVYDKVKQVQLNMNNNSKHLDVHCIFFYLHEQLRNIILQKADKNSIKDILQVIDKGNTTKICPLSICEDINNSSESQYIRKKTIDNAFDILETSNENICNKDTIFSHFKQFIQQKGFTYIIYYTPPSSFNTDIINDIYIIDINEYYYVLEGIYITNDSNSKSVILYNKYKDQWFDLNEQKWSSKLILPSKISVMNLVYSGRKKEIHTMTLQNQLNFKSNVLLCDIVHHEENDVYWKSINCIQQFCPSIIKLKKDFFKSAFHLDESNDNLLIKFNNYLSQKGVNEQELMNEINMLVNKIMDMNDNAPVISSTVGFYLAYMLAYKNRILTSDIKSLLVLDKELINNDIILKLEKLSNQRNINMNIKLEHLLRKIKLCKTERERGFFFLIRIILFFIFMHKNRKDSNEIENEIKALCNDNEQLKPFEERICNNYLREIVKYINKTYSNIRNIRLFYLTFFTIECIKKHKENNLLVSTGGYWILKEYIKCYVKEKGNIDDCFSTLSEGTEVALKILYNHNDDYLIADLLMTSTKSLLIDIFYEECKKYLRDIYYSEQKPLQPILQYSILLFFLFVRSKKTNDKIEQMKNSVYMKNEPSTLIDISLMFLFTISDIRKITCQIKSKAKKKNNTLTQEEQDILYMYELFSNSSEGKKITYSQKETIFNNIKTAVGNYFYGAKYINNVLYITNSIHNLKYEKLATLKNIQFDNAPYLLYVEYNKQIKDNDPYYKRFVCDYNDKYYYEFRGITLVYSGTKDTLFYDKYSQHWYSFNSKSWQDELNFDVIPNIKQIYFIYLRKKTIHKRRELYLNNLRNIPPIDETTFQQCYFDYSSTYRWFCYNNQKLAFQYKDSFARILNTQINIQLNYKKHTHSNSVENPSCLII